VRYDWADNNNTFDDGNKDDQFVVSTDVVITF